MPCSKRGEVAYLHHAASTSLVVKQVPLSLQESFLWYTGRTCSKVVYPLFCCHEVDGIKKREKKRGGWYAGERAGESMRG